jgi:hypothetical protein
MYQDRKELAAAVAARLGRDEAALTDAWNRARPFRYFAVDDLLDPEWARALASHFPSPERLMLRSSLRERKRVGV